MAYTKTTWNDGDTITKDKLNNIEKGVGANDTAITALNGKVVKASASNDGLMSKENFTKLQSLNNYTLPAATTAALGGVKQCTNVAKAADAPTKAEFDALIDALIAAGIMASA